MKTKKNNKEVITVFLVLLLVITIIGVSYAAFTFSKTGTVENAITTGAVTMIYTEGDNKITINNAVPITEDVGKTLSDENYLFDFTININIIGNTTISYEVTAEKDSSSTLANSDVRLYLQRSLDGTNYNEEVLEPSPYDPIVEDDEFGAKAGEMVLDVGSTNKTVMYYYRLRMWVDSSYELSEVAKTFTIKVNAYGKSGGYKERSNPNPPILVGDMIPVIYDDASNSWIKSSTAKGTWYNYDNQMWANAVTIKDSIRRDAYKSAGIGTPINIEDINTFMVWIPRYSYALGNTYGYQIEGAETPSKATPGAFNIKFVRKNVTEMGSGKYTGDTPENYFTPSSFCWGDTCDDEATRKAAGNIELPGIWVSKFELTGTIDDISSIPNAESIRNQNVSSLFTGIQSEINGEIGLKNYGLNGNYDTHMIKNTEWGAFVYLSQSKYGKYGNNQYSGAAKEVAVNNCSNYITGIGANNVSDGKSSTTCTNNTYETREGQTASTTGNIYGIYDASGGAYEYTMGNYNNNVSSSGFSSMPAKRYYNLYDSAMAMKGDAYNGDGTANFYGDWAYSLEETYCWPGIGGYYDDGGGAGLFSFNTNPGAGRHHFSTRFILSAW